MKSFEVPIAPPTSTAIHMPASPIDMKIISPDGKVVFRSNLEEEAKTKIADVLKEENPKTRREILRRLRSEIEAQRSEAKNLKEKHAAKTAELVDLRFQAHVLRDIREWVNSYQLKKAMGSRVHHLQDAARNGKVFLIDKDADFKIVAVPAVPLDDIGPVFIVEHDWAAAFKGANDFDDGMEWRLPFDNSCFEFHITNRRVVVLATVTESDVRDLAVLFEIKDGWMFAPKEGVFSLLYDLVIEQIKAVYVSLEAEVAATEVVRAPHRLNHQRERSGKLPIADHHIVRLSNRHRVARLEAPSDVPGTRRRLHFRRGHWRHYLDHKTWIKWMLVGDPDLGFIDKEYRL